MIMLPMKYSIYIVDSLELVKVVDPKAGPAWSYSEHAIKFELITINS